MAYNWNWQVFFQPSATGEGTYLTWLLEGLKWTVTLSLSAWVIALVVGSIIGVLRTVPNRWLGLLAAAYVEVFRNIPLLVQLFIWYFVLPELLPAEMGNAFKQMNPLAQQFVSALVCLGLFTAARVAEQVASYKKPREVIFVDEIPKTAVGKLNRKALRDRFRDRGKPGS